jgi:hypothetical protein
MLMSKQHTGPPDARRPWSKSPCTVRYPTPRLLARKTLTQPTVFEDQGHSACGDARRHQSDVGKAVLHVSPRLGRGVNSRSASEQRSKDCWTRLASVPRQPEARLQLRVTRDNRRGHLPPLNARCCSRPLKDLQDRGFASCCEARSSWPSWPRTSNGHYKNVMTKAIYKRSMIMSDVGNPFGAFRGRRKRVRKK